MPVSVRPAFLSDGVGILTLLEQKGYFPEPLGFANTFRKTLNDPDFLVRVAEYEGKLVGLAALSFRPQLGLGGTLASLDEFIVTEGSHRRAAERALLKATARKARAMGARKVVLQPTETKPQPKNASQFYIRNAA
jgi:GNAT superfamily N-acetyltransferase